ncbi:MAG: chemotaxis protein CheW, partial [Cyanobacteria bacterium P01_A01_bin.135]
ERATFRERADELRRSPVEEQPADEVRTLAVVSIEGQLFGIDSETIREFITVRDAVPVPCCPPHIVGNINFRGEILTVVDIRKALKLPPSELPSSPRAIVAECGELAVGIVVSTIHDAMFLVSLSDITVVSADLSLRSPYTIGTARYNGQTIAILDLLALLQDEQVVVNQAA